MANRLASALEDALVVMARYPRAGSVKRRLAASVGEETAASIYRAFLSDLATRFGADERWALHWAYDPPESRFAEEVAGSACAFAQSSGNLGARMAAAIAHPLARGFKRVVLIGSDVPHLPLETVALAFRHLAAGADLVLGPVDDGGYCLIGAASVPRVFDGIPWGESGVLAATLESASHAGIDPRLVPTTYDVDDLEGLERLSNDIACGSVDALAETARALEQVFPVRYK